MSFLPRPARPAAALRDFRAFLRTRSPHKIGFAAVALGIPILFMGLFYVDEVEEVYRLPEITWIKTYDPGRTDAAIKAQQKIDTAARKVREEEERIILEKRRAPFKKIDKKLDELGL